MAHGYLTPTPVSGRSPIEDMLAKKAKQEIKKALRQTYGKLKDILSGFKGFAGSKSGAIVQYSADVKNVSVKEVSNTNPSVKKMFSGSNSRMLGAGNSSIAKQEVASIPGESGGIAKRSGGAFTEMPGISSGGGLNAETFFKQATTGVGSSGEYLTNAQRREAFIKSRQEAEKVNSATPSISPDSGIDIVAAVNRNTQMIVSLVEAVKAQTKNDSNLVEKQIQGQETLMLRAAARQEEAQLEQGGDYSGFMTPENFEKRKKNEKKKETSSKLKEFFRGPNPFKKDEGCGCSPFMPGPRGRGPILGGPPGGGGLPIPDYVDQWRDMNRRRGSRLGGGASVMRRGGGARALTRAATKIGGKGLGKAVGKGLAKKIPGVGVLAGGAFAAERAMKGDWLGAGGELLSGIASIIPGLGTGVSTAIDAGLAARDAGLTPFAKGAIITQPTAGLVGEAGNEGIFPLEGSRGKKTFRMFGEGIFQAQRDNENDFAKLQAKGMKQYYETEGGFKKMGEGLKDFFAGLGGVFGKVFDSLTGGAANAATRPFGGGLVDPTISGDEEEYLMRLMIAEAGGEGEVGMAAVGRSVLNRAGLIQSGEVRPGMFNAKSGSIMDVINASGQYQPVREGKLKRDLSPEERARAKKALEMARNQASLRGSLEAQGMSSADINKIMASTGFRTKDAFYDKSQEVNVATLGAHRFNTAGNAKMLTPGNVQIQQGVKAPSQAGLPELPPTGHIAAQKYGAARDGGRKHAGTDFDISGNEKFVSRIGGEVINIGSNPGGYGNYVDIYNAQLGVTERIAEGARVLVGKGQKVQPGTPIVQGETDTGVIHYEIRKGRGGYGFTGTLDPIAFLRSAASKDIASKPGTPGPQAAAPSGSYNIPGAPELSNVLNAANPNTGTPIAAASQQVAMASMGGGTGSPTIVNNYYGGGSQGGPSIQGGSSPGISMEQTGTAIFQELRIRTLA